ncbi:MAG: rRNA maturation RNase YbeY [Eubacterium sp.]|nr:rRNA maturation RNase YbeY [Eubacterium sp.]
MTITITEDKELSYPEEFNTIIKDIIEYSIDYLNCPYECEVEVILTDNDGIHEINKAERQIDAPTDVLSFPMLDFNEPADLSLVEENPSEYFNPETGEMLLGDIVLNLDRVRSQALDFGHSEKREVAFLTAHSMLHLFGYDHMNDDEREVMERTQNDILNKRGYTRDYE